MRGGFIENKQKRESSPWVKGKKKPGPEKANKDLLFGTAFAPLPRYIRIPRARFRFSFL